MNFRRRKETPEEPVNEAPAAPETPQQPDEDPMAIAVAASREKMFTGLDKRIGVEYGAIIRDDFAKHVASDPEHGVELGYLCLLGKIVDYVDALNALDNSTATLGSQLSSQIGAQYDDNGPDEFNIDRKAA